MKKVILILSVFCFFSCNEKEGCTNPAASNYNIDAQIDDGSCFIESIEEDTLIELPFVKTLEIELVSHCSATLRGSVDFSQISSSNISEKGFIYSRVEYEDMIFRVDYLDTGGPSWDILSNIFGNLSSFNGLLTTFNLPLINENTDYYYRAYIITSSGQEHYGDILNFKTPFNEGNGQAGGYIIHDKGSYSDGWRFIEAAPYDIVAHMGSWGSENVDLPGADSYTDGYQNQIDIMANCSDCAPAFACNAFSYGGYTDWYMPSASECRMIMDEMVVNGTPCTSPSGVLSGVYGDLWSSTEVDNLRVQVENGSSTTSESKYGDIWQNRYVRPVRRY